PSVLVALQQAAMDPTRNYGSLLGAAATGTDLNRLRNELLAAVTNPPAGLGATVRAELFNAHQAAQDVARFPWSAVFVVACIRGVAIDLGLESDAAGTHTGRDALLAATSRHATYVLEAHRRRFGPT